MDRSQLTTQQFACQQQQLDELVAILAIYQDALVDLSPPELLQAARAACAGHADATAATAALARRSCSGVLHLTTAQGAPSASLAFMMPPTYPAAAALQCHVTSANLPRAAADALSQQLQQQAQAAMGRECLHELVEALQQHLDQLPVQQEEPQRSQPQQQQRGVRRVLLRLDHMRDRAAYTGTIKQWAAELHLTGWLLFWQSLILIVLEGSSRDVSTYLRQARTVCVDVDSQGRKCRERMLTILDDSASHVAHAPHGGEDGSSTGGHSGLQQQQQSSTTQRAYTDFRELHPETLEQVVEHLSATHATLDAAALRQMLGLPGSH